MRTSPEIRFVVPAGIDDPARPSGGNRYDRRVIDALVTLGRVVHEHPVGDLVRVLADVPDGATVVVDGLLGSFAPEVVVPAADRLRIVVLVHMPFAEADPEVREDERAVLTAAAGVVTTSEWARAWVIRHHGLAPERVRVATPGVDPAPLTDPSADGSRLLCLAAVTRDKGHDILLSALSEITDLDWTCTLAGALDLDAELVSGLHELALRSGIGDRVRFTGPLPDEQVQGALAEADLLVTASRREAFGMGVTEALARGVPAVVSDVGGHAEALGGAGVLVPPDDPDQLAAALRRWLTDPATRGELRAAAAARRTDLGSWTDTALQLAEALDRPTPAAPDAISAGR